MWITREGDCLDRMRELAGNSVDSVVTDPPYGLEFMGKKWDKFEPYAYQQWCQQWAAECLRVLKPGGFILACGGTRTYHRLTCGIEDAGFEIRDSLIWIYGQGFPKSRDIGKAIDSEAGAEREVVGQERNWGASKAEDGKQAYGDYVGTWDITAPATDAAAEWQGWGTALKPAHEPIVMARKPFKGTVAGNVLEFRTGAINIDGCRVGSEPRVNGPAHNVDGSGWGMRPNTAARAVDGRWPANVMLSHSAYCVLTGEARTVKAAYREDSRYLGSPDKDVYGKGLNQVMSRAYGDPDGNETLPVWECAAGCPVALMDAQSGQSTSRKQPRTERKGGKATNFAMSTSGATHADQGGASRFFYCAKAGKSERPFIEGLPGHPTVKPLALMRWLARLVTPPGGLALDLFAGTGTTGEACELEGFDSLLFEQDADSIRRIDKRMSRYGEMVA